jgi:Zn-dependent protease with chaperone function
MLLNDALLAKNPERWTLQMVAHEAKHFALDDNVKALFLLSGLLLVGLWLVNRVVGDCTHRWPVRFGFSQLGDPASLPLVVFVLMAAFLVLLPAINAFRQHVELEADRFALEFNRDNRAQAEMIASWAADSKLQVEEVSLFSQLFRASIHRALNASVSPMATTLGLTDNPSYMAISWNRRRGASDTFSETP